MRLVGCTPTGQRARLSRAVKGRLAQQDGFTLAEQLVALLFMGFLCMVVAAGITASVRVNERITTTTRANTMLQEAVTEINYQLEYSQAVLLDAGEGDGYSEDKAIVFSNGAWVFQSPSTNAAASLVTADEGILLVAYGTVEGQGGSYTATPRPEADAVIVANRDTLQVAFSEGGEPAYDSSTNSWTYILEVRLAKTGKTLRSDSITVRRANKVPEGNE